LSTNNETYEPLFFFTGTNMIGGTNGMYVNNLDLSLLDDYTNEISIDNNLVIYFVSAVLNPSVNTGILTPELFLDGQFGGHLRWVGVGSLLKQKTPAALGGKMVSGGKFQLSITGVSGQTNVVWASTNLINWIPIYTNNGGSTTITDSAAKNFKYRYYRIK
jgi:hypothetical protein